MTVEQRQEIKRLHDKEKIGIRPLAARYRVQIDVQQLPVIEGESGFEYAGQNSEIHSECTSEIVAGVFQRALDQLPPFYRLH